MNRSAVTPGRCQYPRASPAPPTYSSPITPTGTGSSRASSTYTRRSGIGTPMLLSPARTAAAVTAWYVTCTVVSVIPYMFTSCGRSTPCRSSHGPSMRTSSASPPKITSRSARASPSPHPSTACNTRNAEGVWFSTVTRSSTSTRYRSSGDCRTHSGTTTRRPPCARAPQSSHTEKSNA